MKTKHVLLVSALLLLSGCGPKLEGNTVMGRLVTITNKDTSAFTIKKLVANGNNTADCTDTPNVALAPGESYTASFVVCGRVASMVVETDKGNVSLNWNN